MDKRKRSVFSLYVIQKPKNYYRGILYFTKYCEYQNTVVLLLWQKCYKEGKLMFYPHTCEIV